MTTIQTHTLAVPGVELVYDVRGPLPPAGGRPALLMVGQPMTAEGFTALADNFRTVRSSPMTRVAWVAAFVPTAGQTTHRSSRQPICTY